MFSEEMATSSHRDCEDMHISSLRFVIKMHPKGQSTRPHLNLKTYFKILGILKNLKNYPYEGKKQNTITKKMTQSCGNKIKHLEYFDLNFKL